MKTTSHQYFENKLEFASPWPQTSTIGSDTPTISILNCRYAAIN